MSYVSARFLSLLLFFCVVILTYLTSLRVDEKDGYIIGLIASALTLVSPLLITYSSSNMIEMLGTLIFILTTYLYLKGADQANRVKQIIFFALLGLVLGICMVTKYNFALHIIPAIGVIMLVDLVSEMKGLSGIRFEKPHERAKNKKVRPAQNGFILNLIKKAKTSSAFYIFIKYLVAAIPLLLITILWFTSHDMERKISMVFWTRGVTSQSNQSGGFEHYFFFLKDIINNFTFSKILGLSVLASIFGSVLFYKNKAIRALSICILFSLFISTFVIPYRLDRFFTMEAPWAFIIFGFILVTLTRKVMFFELRQKLASAAVLILLVLPVLFDLRNIPLNFMMIDYGPRDVSTMGRVADLLDFYKMSIPKGSQIACPLSAPRISPYTIGFHFRDWGGPVFTLYDFGNPAYAQSEYFLTIEPMVEKPVIFDNGPTPGDLLKWNESLRQSEKQGYLLLFSQKDFSKLGVKAMIYKRKT
jgi:hypothetical protein